MITRTLSACVAVLATVQVSAAVGAGAGGWSTARTLGSCAAAIAPRVAFPSESPSIPTGPGAVVWAKDPNCSASRGAAPALAQAALGRDERPSGAAVQPLFAGTATALEAVGASKGRVAVATMLAGASPAVTLTQGRAPQALPVASLQSAGAPFSLAHAYLGDAAIATLGPGPTIAVRVERWFASAFASPLRVPIDAAPVSALLATMDYRSDVLLAWQQNGAIYAHMLRASGRAEPTQRIGTSAPHPQLRALVSDNDHGMIAWSSAEGSTSSRTTVRIAFSGAGVRFAGSRRVASFADPQGAGRAPGSLALERLSTENVMLAWTDAEAGAYVVRAAPAVFAGTRPSVRLSDPSSRSVLAGLAAGPAGEAVALWKSSPQASAPDPARSELWAARTVIERHGRVASRGAEMVARAGAGASLAVDPGSDRAVAAWVTAGPRPRVQYAVGPGASGYTASRPAGNTTQAAGAGHPVRLALAAVAAAAVAVLTVLALRRRARARSAGGGGSGMHRRR